MTAAVIERSDDRQLALAEPQAAVGDSLSVAVWTLISRLTGLIRGVVVAAVLGATFFANSYQFTNALPNLVFYGFLGGSLFSSLLAPALVGHLDSGDLASARRVAGGLFGTVLALTAIVLPVAVVIAPLALRLVGGNAGAPVSSAAAGADQTRVIVLLVLMLMPQVPLYAVVGTATAIMNSQRRFALAAAAPALENLGTIAVLAAAAVLYPDARTLADPPTGLLLLLGLGTTGSVAVHAGAQWWGARRTGVVLLPRRGWRDPQVRILLGQAGTAVVQAGLGAVQLMVLLALADRVAGGVVGFQLALNFYFLPVALVATPVALSLAPRLSRMVGEHDGPLFRDTFVNGLTFALFLALPAAVGYLVLAHPLADAVSYGAFPQAGGQLLVAGGLAGLSVGVAAEAVFLVSTYACYARGDTRTPLRAMILQAVVCLLVASGSTLLDGPAALTVLGAALSAGGVAGSVLLVVQVLRRSAPEADGHGRARLGGPLARAAVCAAAMALPTRLVADAVFPLDLPLPGVTATVAGALTGAAVYLTAQRLLRAPELTWVGGAVLAKLPIGAVPIGRRFGAAPIGRLIGAVLHRIPRPRRPDPLSVLRDVAVLAGCLAVGGLIAVDPVLGVAAALGLAFAAVVWARPVLASYLLIGITPLTAGIDRGTVLPVFRPNEALLFGLVGVLGLRAVVRARGGDAARWRPSGIEWSLLAFALCSSLVPLIMMVGRGRHVTGDDLNYALVLWKLIAVYGIVRFTVRTTGQVMRCLVVSMSAGAVVSLVAVLQSLGLFGVPRLLATFYAPFGVDSALAIGRGSSTLSLPAAVADLAIVNLLISLSLLMRRRGNRPLLLASAVVSGFGVVGAAEFSTFIGMVIALLAFIVITGQRRLLLYSVPISVIGSVVLEPVISNRLDGFQSASGIPVSWIGRLRNLQTFFWPELGRDWNWVLGVRLQARVPASSQEFGWIWIESGYTWLLWGGGLPLLGCYVAMVWTTMRAGRRFAKVAADPLAVVGITMFCAMAADIFLMLLDPHITYRGAADALFTLFALARPLPDTLSEEETP